MDEYNVTNTDTMVEDSNDGGIIDTVLESVSENVSTDNGTNITLVINNSKSDEPVSDSEVENNVQEVVIREEDLILNDVTVETKRITANDTTGLKSVVLGVIGPYETTVTDYEYRNNNNTYYSHSINVEPDYAWMITAALFAICIYSCFRLYGLVFGKGGRR